MKSSLREISRMLPADFVERLYETFPPLLVEEIVRGYGGGRYTTLRVNTIKASVLHVLKELWKENIKVERVPWYDEALIVKGKKERDLMALDLYRNGAIYLQSLSSMIPPLVLDPQPSEKVLDMAAAPGSKTTQMTAMMKNEGEILANDINEIRIEILKHNVEVQGATIVRVTCEDGAKLGDEYHETFDRVLLDAPCSGEGLFLTSDPRTYRSWSPKLVKKSSAQQRRLMRSAIKALKPGGVLVYSTCTLSLEENEVIIDGALREFPDIIAVQEITLKLPRALEGISRFKDGVLSDEVKKARRILPSETMEGFFICKLKKLLPL